MSKKNLPDEVMQVVIVRKDSQMSPAALALHISRASIELRDKFDPNHPEYVGRYEEKYFKDVMEKWYQTGRTQEYYEVDDFIELREIAFQCGMQAVPSSFLDRENEESAHCLILGPFDKYELEELTQYAKFIPA